MKKKLISLSIIFGLLMISIASYAEEYKSNIDEWKIWGELVNEGKTVHIKDVSKPINKKRTTQRVLGGKGSGYLNYQGLYGKYTSNLKSNTNDSIGSNAKVTSTLNSVVDSKGNIYFIPEYYNKYIKKYDPITKKVTNYDIIDNRYTVKLTIDGEGYSSTFYHQNAFFDKLTLDDKDNLYVSVGCWNKNLTEGSTIIYKLNKDKSLDYVSSYTEEKRSSTKVSDKDFIEFYKDKIYFTTRSYSSKTSLMEAYIDYTPNLLLRSSWAGNSNWMDITTPNLNIGAEGIIKDDYLYVVRESPVRLDKINLNNLKDQKTIMSMKSSLWDVTKHNNKFYGYHAGAIYELDLNGKFTKIVNVKGTGKNRDQITEIVVGKDGYLYYWMYNWKEVQFGENRIYDSFLYKVKL